MFYGFFGPEDLTPSRAFSALSYVNLLRVPLFLLPFTITLVAQYTITFNRIQEFLMKPDVKEKTEAIETGSGEVTIEDGEFKYDPSSPTPILSNINFQVTLPLNTKIIIFH